MVNASFRYQPEDQTQPQNLYGEQVVLADLAAQHGTPLYVYSQAQMLGNLARLQAAFEGMDAQIHYSLKANANLSIINLMQAAGIGIDAVSAGEIYRALHAGVAPSEIVFAGVGKTSEELEYALAQGVGWFNVENPDELLMLDRLAAAQGQTVQVALRLNPEVAPQTHRHIATGHGGAKFGLSAEHIAALLARQERYPNLKIAGLHIHIGSQLGEVSATVAAIQKAQALAAPYPHLRTLNIGGGFPVTYTPDQSKPSIETFAEAIRPHVAGWRLKLEPGRFIVADAGVLLVKVLYTKQQAGQNFIITDGSMAELLRPALYEALHPILPLQQPTPDAVLERVNIVGPVCETADVLRVNIDFPAVGGGDYLAVMMAGAYGFVMASNYNARPRPAEVLINGTSAKLIRQRESWADLIRGEA